MVAWLSSKLRLLLCKLLAFIAHRDFRLGIPWIYAGVTLLTLLYITIVHAVYIALDWPPSMSDALLLVTLLYGFGAAQPSVVLDNMCSIMAAAKLGAASFAAMVAGYTRISNALLLLAGYALMFRGLYVASKVLYDRCDRIASKWCREWRREFGC